MCLAIVVVMLKHHWLPALCLLCLPTTLLAQTVPAAEKTNATTVTSSHLGVAVEPQGGAQLYPASDKPEDEPTTERRWYGWQTIATDASAITLLALAANVEETAQSPLIAAAIGTYVLGAPIVHAAHGHIGKSAGSLALRLMAPAAWVGMGAMVSACDQAHESSCVVLPIIAGVGGIALGVLFPSILDAAVIAREDVPKTVSWTPTVQLAKSGGTVGIAGTF